MINKYRDEAAHTSMQAWKMLTKERRQAEQAAVERLLNAYFRETGVFDPTAEGRGSRENGLPLFLTEEIQKQGNLLKLTLPVTGVVLLGAVSYVSAFGHHRYGRTFWAKGAGSADFALIQETAELAGFLLNELAASTVAAPEKKRQLVTNLLAQVENSIEKTTIYIQDSQRPSHESAGTGSFLALPGVQRLYTAEQSLVYGHPFHPTPKSSQGFLSEDLKKYSPELGASFALHYFACAVELVQESFLSADQPEEMWFPADVTEAAGKRLGNEWQQQYRLIPCHPWQAAHLKTWPEVQQLMNQGALIDLGPLGAPVYPTSSVRTVWDPEHTYFFKLPLNVRITHFVRVNPIDQCERTMDASRVLHYLNFASDLNQQPSFDGFTILHEAGYRTIVPRQMPEDAQARLSEAFGMILRENPAVTVTEEELPVVVAGLLEHHPSRMQPPIMDALQTAAAQCPHLTQEELVAEWVRQYIGVSMIPLLWMFTNHGIGMEAHVQNSMITIQKGWPSHFYVRDLEGVSIARTFAHEQGMFGQTVTDESPVLYRDEEAWERFKYYVVVNHLGHLLHTLAFYSGMEETALWEIVAHEIQQSELIQNSARPSYADELIQNPWLPAKANLTSWFYQRGERPLYVNIPNPLTAFRRDV